jgi:hypothetical protein
VRRQRAQVFGERGDAGVTLFGFVHRAAHDAFEIAAQHALQRRRRCARDAASTAVAAVSLAASSRSTSRMRGGSRESPRARAGARDPLSNSRSSRRAGTRRSRGDRRAGVLLGRGVFGRHQRRGGARRFVGAGIEQLGDAEVEQLERAVRCDEHVRGLDVAMHDEVAMRVRHRVADVEEQREARVDVEPPRIAMREQRLAVDDSIANHGRPSSARPPSSRRAMCG